MLNVINSASWKIRQSYAYMKCKMSGMRLVYPNYAFFEDLISGGIAIDVGVGDAPDLTLELINKYKLETFIVDPTVKHSEKLKAFEQNHDLVHYLPFALGAKNELKTFYESKLNVSGSLRADHTNMLNDPVTSYTVKVITLNELLQKCGNREVSIMKIDIEGEEYNLINSLSKDDLKMIRQLIVEFHHETVKNSIRDTRLAIEKIENFGMKAIVYNRRDCLFYWA